MSKTLHIIIYVLKLLKNTLLSALDTFSNYIEH